MSGAPMANHSTGPRRPLRFHPRRADNQPVAHRSTAPLVLVVDDEPDLRNLLARVLEHQGFVALEAASGEQAWGFLNDGLVPAAILLDLVMPGMGGLAFLQRLRADPRFADLPVGVLTGHCFLDRRTEASLAAMKAQLRFKPLELEAILAFTHGLATGPSASAMS